MASIDLFRAAQRTSTSPLPHQQAAWNWLQEQLSPGQIADFAEVFGAEPAPKLPLQQELNMRPRGRRH